MIAALLLVPVLLFRAPPPTRWIEVQARDRDSAAWGDTVLWDLQAACDPRFPDGPDDATLDCTIVLDDKDMLHRVRACDFVGCSDWTEEPRLTCDYAGGTGCPVCLYPAPQGACL